MTMTETKLSDEEIQALIEKAEHKSGTWGMVESATVMQMVQALSQLQAENNALKEDKRRLNWVIYHTPPRMVFYSLRDNLVRRRGESMVAYTRRAIDAALQQEQERNDG